MTERPQPTSDPRDATGGRARADAPGLPDLILASASPRRRELLERVGLRLIVAPADIDETPRPAESASDYVRRMATEKTEAAAGRLATTAGTPMAGATAAPTGGTTANATAPAMGPAILAADTIVVVEGSILGKPTGPDDARAMLDRLAGRRHDVITAYRIRFGTRDVDRAVTTTVAFRLLDPAELDAYIACGEWQGKAGGYAVQGVASAFVTELRGSLTNVIGLPLAEALADLRALGALPGYPPRAFPAVA